ncbi:uncharacterized protein LAJ45_06912 [Morchella importuna]|uniref:uncharacterized protein n=1 Tax=Morchella importuna TaxID=1174673 RepID=UPI001E8D6A50|nr:uncharacterized protein LAJ45_06912 [Morchella importuna]KAH8148938.1 hypothetical protein LAJ45_06912 [Morchella importuna]
MLFAGGGRSQVGYICIINLEEVSLGADLAEQCMYAVLGGSRSWGGGVWFSILLSLISLSLFRSILSSV